MLSKGLEAFILTARKGSFRKAAETLMISPVALVKRINALEERLGLKLFNRTNQGITLTRSGETLLPRAEKLQKDAALALDAAREALSEESRTFRVGSSLLNPCRPFVELWERVAPQFPKWDLRIVPFDDEKEGIISVIEGLGEQVDFIYGPCDSRAWLKRCNFAPIRSCRYEIAVPKNHPLASRPLIRYQDLEGLKIWIPSEEDSPRVADLRRRLNVCGAKTVSAGPFYDMAIFNRVAAGDGALLTLECWKDVNPLLKTIPCEWFDANLEGILYEADPRPGITQIVEAMKKAAGADLG